MNLQIKFYQDKIKDVRSKSKDWIKKDVAEDIINHYEKEIQLLDKHQKRLK